MIKNILPRLSIFSSTEKEKLELTSSEKVFLSILLLTSASLKGAKELIEISLDNTVGTRQDNRNLAKAVLTTVLGVVTLLKLIESPTNTLVYTTSIATRVATVLFWGGLIYSLLKLDTMTPRNRINDFNKNYLPTLNRGLLFHEAVTEAITTDREHPKLEYLRESITAKLR